ncbi:MAG: hypothetical protein KDC26_08770 [Armatimonadetes bacterium]|nr:hypothetical protein [Armatimonadota bacterium]
MTVLIFENNLMWSPRLMKSVQGLGHKAVLFEQIPDEFPVADCAILNLAYGPDEEMKGLIARLRGRNVYVIGHAGHKEKEKLEVGKEMGCDRLATNSEITFKLEKLLNEV